LALNDEKRCPLACRLLGDRRTYRATRRNDVNDPNQTSVSLPASRASICQLEIRKPLDHRPIAASARSNASIAAAATGSEVGSATDWMNTSSGAPAEIGAPGAGRGRPLQNRTRAKSVRSIKRFGILTDDSLGNLQTGARHRVRAQPLPPQWRSMQRDDKPGVRSGCWQHRGRLLTTSFVNLSRKAVASSS
jgi:hypothetical protein